MFKNGLLVLTLFVMIIFSSCVADGDYKTVYKGSEVLIEKSFDIDSFKNIDASYSFKVELIQSDNYEVVLRVNKSLVDKIKVKKENGTLFLGVKDVFTFTGNKTLSAVIKMPDLESISLSGASRVQFKEGFKVTNDLKFKLSGASKAEGIVKAKDIYVNASGASSVELDANAVQLTATCSGASKIEGKFKIDDINLDFSGASSIKISGSGKDSEIKASGASHIDLTDFNIKDAKVELSGASRADLNMDGKLKLNASGASSLRYKGNAVIDKIDTSGGSSIKQIE